MTIKAIINAVKGEPWCRVLTLLMRLTVGGVFIFSGFTKGVDPWGAFYKVNDYLMAMGLEQWTGTALFTGVALAAAELMLGVAIAVGAYRRSAPVLALVMMMVMTPLTLWIAVTGAVPDCGCFGDALHLSGWATLGKNVLLTLGIIYLLLFNRTLRGIYGPAVQWMVMAATFALMMAVAYYGYFEQPLIDFRPYPVGTRLVSMPADDSAATDDEFTFVYSKDGQEQEFSIDSLPDEEDGWQYITRYHTRRPHGKVIVQGHNEISIMDDDGNDVTLDVLADSRRTLLLLFPDLPRVGVVNSYDLNELGDAAMVDQVDIIGLTPATADQVEQWRDMSMASYPIYSMDDSQLKMIARGNPAVVYLEDGVIKWERTLNSLSTVDTTAHLSEMGDDMNPDGTVSRLVTGFLLSMLALLIINRTHLIVRYLYYKRRKSLQPTGANAQQPQHAENSKPEAEDKKTETKN